MKCQVCNEREAAIIVAMNNGKEESSMYVCHRCIQNMGIDLHKTILDQIVNQISQISKKENIVCENCGMTLREFSETGRYGCAKCHEYFESKREDSNKDMELQNKRALQQDADNRKKLEQYFSSTLDSNSSKFHSILSIKKLLDTAIADENYEEAAKLRDELRKLEK